MTHAPAHPHGPITQVFPDVWTVTGSFPIAPGVTIPRTMTIVRKAASEQASPGPGKLALFNSVRLTPAGEAELEQLGTVTDVVRLGGFHGTDDPWFKARFGATLWAPAGMRKPYVEYRTLGEVPDHPSPLSDGAPFIFRGGSEVDAAMLIARHGGILVTCDAYQNWTQFDNCSFLARPVVKLLGFGPAVIGGPWARRMGPGIYADFERLVELPFLHLFPGHGEPLLEKARSELPGAMKRRFGR